MKNLFFVILVSFSLNASKAQSAKTIFFEAGGPGILSINFDTRFSKKNDGGGVRAGIGYYNHEFKNKKYSAINIPVGINFLKGRDGKNFFELGAGVTPVIATDSIKNENFGATFGHLLIGYRLQPRYRGFCLRIFVSPCFGNFGFIPYYGGISMGYKFRTKTRESSKRVK